MNDLPTTDTSSDPSQKNKGVDPASPFLIYVGDPMCSWCWGLAEVMEKALERYSPQLQFEILLGGLRPGPDKVVDEEMKDFLLSHWARVEELSGQTFDRSILDQVGWIYNSEPACRAVITARALFGSLKAFEFFKSIQSAFYTNNQLTTTDDVIEQLANKAGFDVPEFMELYRSSDATDMTTQEFKDVINLGVSGFPTLLLVKDGAAILILNGYGDFETLSSRLDEALASS